MQDNMDKKTRDTGFALACWILVALILLVFFFIKKDTIVSNIKHTNFVNRVMGKAEEHSQSMSAEEGGKELGEGEEEADESEDIEQSPIEKPYAALSQNEQSFTGRSQNEEDGGQRDSDSRRLSVEGGQQAAGDETSCPIQNDVPSAITKTTIIEDGKGDVRPMKKPVIEGDVAAAVVKQPQTVAKLCFVVVDSDGTVSRHISNRSLPKTTSPLTASINALLSGPDDGSETLIPEGTRLLGAEVRGGIATLNFSEEFAFNPVGVEGYMAQLMQVVYTATFFSTVSRVQIVINGQHVDYLGSEGEWIGSPLSRASFR